MHVHSCIQVFFFLLVFFIGGQKFKTLEIYQTAGPIGPKFGTRVRIHLGMDKGKNTINPSIPQRAFWGGLRGQQLKKGLDNLPNGWTDFDHILVHVCGFIWEWTYAKNN